MLGMLENLANATLETNFPLFDVYWNQNPPDADGFLDHVAPESEEVAELLGDHEEAPVLYRVQNFFMNLSYRSLLYYYSKKEIDFKEKKVMVHFEDDNAFESAHELVAIEDMSYFMVRILKHDVQKFKKKEVKKLKSG